jgi:hypothetical protein
MLFKNRVKMKSRRANRIAGAILIITDYFIIFLTTFRASYKLQNFKINSNNQSGLPGEHKGLPVVFSELY